MPLRKSIVKSEASMSNHDCYNNTGRRGSSWRQAKGSVDLRSSELKKCKEFMEEKQ